MNGSGTVRSTIPARLDALPWSGWHWRVVVALGVTWLLDGLEVTVVGSLGPVLQRPATLGLTTAEVGWTGSAYIAGAVLGALYFGRLADRLGRKRLFLVTLAVYLAATVLTAFSFDFASFALCRVLTGFGIGGESAAINSAIDELVPARMRGVVDLAINGTFWIGAAAGAALSIVLLDPAFVGPEPGWRLAFASWREILGLMTTRLRGRAVVRLSLMTRGVRQGRNPDLDSTPPACTEMRLSHPVTMRESRRRSEHGSRITGHRSRF
jgi:MFS family permease